MYLPTDWASYMLQISCLPINSFSFPGALTGLERTHLFLGKKYCEMALQVL